MSAFASWALARLKEPSTYAGLAAVVASMTFLPHAREIAALIPQIGLGIAGVLGVFAVVLPERGA